VFYEVGCYNAGLERLSKEEPLYNVGGNVKTIIENSMEMPQKAKIELPYDPVIILLGIYPKECKSGYNRDTCTPMFISAQFTVSKLCKQPICPTTDEWIKKMWYIYTMEFYSEDIVIRGYRVK
jgi:hypothetical protein